jgi:hypothetical protein
MYPMFTAALSFHRRSGSSRTKILAGRSNCSMSGSPDPRLPASRIGNAPNVANWWKANSLSAGTAALPSPAETQEMMTSSCLRSPILTGLAVFRRANLNLKNCCLKDAQMAALICDAPFRESSNQVQLLSPSSEPLREIREIRGKNQLCDKNRGSHGFHGSTALNFTEESGATPPFTSKTARAHTMFNLLSPRLRNHFPSLVLREIREIRGKNQLCDKNRGLHGFHGFHRSQLHQKESGATPPFTSKSARAHVAGSTFCPPPPNHFPLSPGGTGPLP